MNKWLCICLQNLWDCANFIVIIIVIIMNKFD